MLLTELDELRPSVRRGGTAPEHVTELVDLYKYGIRENRWSAMMDKLRDDPAAALRRRVKGQEPAIAKIVSVLKRSVLGFSGMQHSSGTKPKGVLFLAGPTGTGKTEIVKAVTELLFGDERSYLRFDMSEYAADASDQKLFGAPPGYVGYEARRPSSPTPCAPTPSRCSCSTRWRRPIPPSWTSSFKSWRTAA